MQTLTPEQRRNWNIDGYLLVEGALSPDRVAFFSDKIDEVRKRPGYEPLSGMLPRGHYGWVEQCADQNPEAFMDRRDLLSYDQSFIDLIDHAPVFDLIVDIMGPNLAFSMSQAIVRASGDGFEGFTHTDGGEGQREVRVTETSRPIAVKALYLLTDVEGRDAGNFTVYPGSHMRPFPWDRQPPLVAAIAGRGASGRQGRRLLHLLPRALARAGAEPFRPGAQDAALQLFADVHARLRL